MLEGSPHPPQDSEEKLSDLQPEQEESGGFKLSDLSPEIVAAARFKLSDLSPELQAAARLKQPTGQPAEESAAPDIKTEAVTDVFEPEVLTEGKEASEAEKSKKRAIEIVLQDGGVQIITTISRDLSPDYNNYSGYQPLLLRVEKNRTITEIKEDIYKRFCFFKGRDIEDPYYLNSDLNKNGTKELIDVHELIDNSRVSRRVPAKKLLRLIPLKKDEFEIEPGPNYGKPILHKDVVEGGKDEPAVLFTYYIPPQSKWACYDGRSGQFLLAEITLPETEANELKRILETDPHIMRAIIESVMKKRLITSNPDAWDQPYKMGDPLRPPYEKWDAELNDEEILILTEPDMSEF